MAADHENDDGRGTKLARLCNAANGRTFVIPFASGADDDLTAVSPNGGCDRCWAEDLGEHRIS